MTDEELAKTIGRLVVELNADIERYVVARLDDCLRNARLTEIESGSSGVAEEPGSSGVVEE